MASYATRTFLKNSKSLPQLIRSQIIGRGIAQPKVNAIAGNNQILRSLRTSDQKLTSLKPDFRFSESGFVFGSFPAQRPSVIRGRDGGKTSGYGPADRGGSPVADEEEYEEYKDLGVLDDDTLGDSDDDDFYGVDSDSTDEDGGGSDDDVREKRVLESRV